MATISACPLTSRSQYFQQEIQKGYEFKRGRKKKEKKKTKSCQAHHATLQALSQHPESQSQHM